jgi:oxygen-independent coproporphyrinogen III oxidase
MQISNFEGQKFLNSSLADQDFKNLFNKPGPYYNCYPILGQWKSYKEIKADYKESIIDFFKKNPDKPISLYVHIPYCAKLCYYCCCRLHVSNNRETINNFVKVLVKEIDMFNSLLKENNISPNIKDIHFGGGTPSHLTVYEIEEIIQNLKKFISLKDLSEFSMEIDPRVVEPKNFETYSKLGIDRISFGVQDFDPVVQKKINREQSFDLIESLMKNNLEKYFKGVNFDLLYGLPGQTKETFQKTIELTKQLSPERITLIKYAHIPNKVKHMKMIKEEDLPDVNDLPVIFMDSTKQLIEGGYDWVGIDHFAKKTDQLSLAKKKGEVYRNFGGETPGFTKDIISLGPTSTSGFGNYYFQNTYDLKEYREIVNSGNFPISRGYVLNKDDLIRRECNFSLQCNQTLDIDEISLKYEINFNDYFKKELIEFKQKEKEGMVNFNENQIKVTTYGRYFVRQICQIFDTFFDYDNKYEIHGN